MLLSLAACRDELPTAPPAPAALPAVAATTGPQPYVILFRPGVRDVDALVSELTRAHGGTPTWRYRTVLKGYAATLPASAAVAIQRNPNVAAVVPDGIASVAGSGSQALTSAQWGLDRIDQLAATRTNLYTWQQDGAGVEAYILDTGIRFTHREFGGRARSLYDYVDNDATAEECHGHGSHVAGTVGGATTGVAKQVTLYAVRVLGCGGSGAYAGIIAAIDSITQRKLANPTVPMVGNLSLSGGYYEPVNRAIEASVAAGVVWSIAAGNGMANACNVSPASALGALTVGASTNADIRSSFSNWGTCVDLFAPGSSIYSATKDGDATYASWNGTSMAAPHVAGVAALYLAAFPDASAAEVNAAITARAATNLLRASDLGLGSPNRLLQSLITATRAGSPPPGSHLLTVGLGGNGGTGSVSGPGIGCAVATGGDCGEALPAGTVVTLTATPGPYGTVRWSGACSGTDLTCTVTMSQAQGVIASFLVPRVQVYRSGSPVGVVTSAGGEIGCGTGGSCAADFPVNTTVTLTATVPTGAVFTGWGGACTGTALTCTVTLTSYATVAAYANYATTTTYGLSVTRNGLGAGTVTSSPAGISCGTDCSEAYASGTTVTLTATPEAGSIFGGWSGCTSASGTTCTVGMAAARSVVATFQPSTAGSPAVELHTGGLTATKAVTQNSWSATATVVVHDGAHAAVVGATVTLRLSGAASGSVTCTTQASGSCGVTRSGLKSSSLTFTVGSIALSGATYLGTANHPTSSVTIVK